MSCSTPHAHLGHGPEPPPWQRSAARRVATRVHCSPQPRWVSPAGRISLADLRLYDAVSGAWLRGGPVAAESKMVQTRDVRERGDVDGQLRGATRRARRRSLAIVVAVGLVSAVGVAVWRHFRPSTCQPLAATVQSPAPGFRVATAIGLLSIGSAATGTPPAGTSPTTKPGNVPFNALPTGPGGSPPLTPLPGPAFGTTSEVPRSTGPPATTAQVTVLKPNHLYEAALVAAFSNYEGLVKTCKAQTVAGIVYLATVKVTGVSWAVAGFKPASGCYEAGGEGPPLCGSQVPAFDVVPPPPVGVIEKQPHGEWSMNNQAGKPFPCPPAGGATPGPYNPYVPVEVLDAWKIPYVAPNCYEIYPTRHG